MSQIKFEILGVKLVAIEDKINHQTYLVEMKPINLNIKWGGAGVIIVNRELDFKTSDYLVISPFANAIAWYFDAVKKILYESELIDHLSKFSLFKSLARVVNNAPKNISEVELLLLMHLEVKIIAIKWDEADAL